MNKRPKFESLLVPPDKRRVELRVNKDHHLKGHGDPQAADAGHHCLKPEHTCEREKNRANQLTGQIWMASLPSSMVTHCREWRRWWSRRLRLRCWPWRREAVGRRVRWWTGWGRRQGTQPDRRWGSQCRRSLPGCPASWSSPGRPQRWWTWRRRTQNDTGSD